MDIAALKASAEKATPGPWKVRPGSAFDTLDAARCAAIDAPGWSQFALVATKMDNAFDSAEGVANATLIALANPTAILSLIERVEALAAELDCRVGDLVMLRRAVEEGDPKAELLFRIDDMLRETRAALSPTNTQADE